MQTLFGHKTWWVL